MNIQRGEESEEATVAGFEIPPSPDSSYNNIYPSNDDEAQEPLVVPPHLQRTILSYPASADMAGDIPPPDNASLNHLYIGNRDASRAVVALGFTHRYRAKFVTVVLYKPAQRRASSSNI